MAVRLGELLLREKRITPTQLQEALNHQKANGGKLGMTLVKLGMVKDEEITALLSRQYGVPFINLAQFDIDASVLHTIDTKTLPSRAAKAAELVRQSVVRVRGYGDDPKDAKAGEKERGVGAGQRHHASGCRLAAAQDPERDDAVQRQQRQRQGQGCDEQRNGARHDQGCGALGRRGWQEVLGLDG